MDGTCTVLFQVLVAALPNAGRYAKSSVQLQLRLVGTAGFEPTTSCTPSKRASQAALRPAGLGAKEEPFNRTKVRRKITFSMSGICYRSLGVDLQAYSNRF